MTSHGRPLGSDGESLGSSPTSELLGSRAQCFPGGNDSLKAVRQGCTRETVPAYCVWDLGFGALTFGLRVLKGVNRFKVRWVNEAALRVP